MKQRYKFITMPQCNKTGRGRGWYVDNLTGEESQLTFPLNGISDSKIFTLVYRGTATYWYIENYEGGTHKYRLVVFKIIDGQLFGEKCVGLSDTKKLLLPLYSEQNGCIIQRDGLQIVQKPFEDIVHIGWGEK